MIEINNNNNNSVLMGWCSNSKRKITILVHSDLTSAKI